MNLYTYQHEVAIRTMDHDLGPQTQLASLTLGIVGEFAELKVLHYEPVIPSQEQIKDEGGDVLWYIANVCNVLNLEIYHFSPYNGLLKETNPEELLNLAAIYYGAIADVVKKTIAQGHVLDIETIYLEIQRLFSVLGMLFAYYDLTMEEVCAYNNQKLLKRYPNGFESVRSVEREV